MADICVVHLVWKPLGLEPFHNFLASYRQNQGGIKHRLVIAFNGFDSEADVDNYRKALAGTPHESLFIKPPVQDIPAYFQAAHELECEYISFLNSYSALLDPEWLGKLYEHARREEVGVVGATGSWQSGHSLVLFQLGRPSAYSELLKDYVPSLPWKPKVFELSKELEARIRQQPLAQRFAYRLYYGAVVAPFYYAINGVRYSIPEKLRQWRKEREHLRRFFAGFEPFPAFHVRTNTFMIRRQMMLKLKRGKMREKDDAYRFESSEQSMTNQVLQMGLKALVVGRDGKGYEKEEWPLSETFWQGEQRNLLVSDNQTNDYTYGSARRRILLSRVAWGDKARPSVPELSRAGEDAVASRGRCRM